MKSQVSRNRAVLMILGHDLFLPYPDNRVLKEAKSLSSAGYDVTVLCWSKRLDVPREEETHDGFRVLRVDLPLPGREEWIALKWPAYLAIRKRMVLEALDFNPDVVHCHDLETLPIGVSIKRKTGARLVYDSHEDWPMMEAAKSRLMGIMTRLIELASLPYVDLIIASSEHIRRKLDSRSRKSVVVMNCSDTGASAPGHEGHDGNASELRLGYFGGLLPGRFIIEAIETISEQDVWRFEIAGDGFLRDTVNELSEAASNVEFLGPIPHDEVMERCARCDASLIMFDPSIKNNQIGAPNRLFESMAVGVAPIVTVSTYASRIVQQEGCGFVSEYDPHSLLHLLEELADNQHELAERGARGHEAFVRQYNWQRQAVRLSEAYKGL